MDSDYFYYDKCRNWKFIYFIFKLIKLKSKLFKEEIFTYEQI